MNYPTNRARRNTISTTPIGQINYAISLSDFLEKVLKKHPHFLAQWWQHPPQFSDCQHYASRLADQLSTIQNEEQLYKTLRDFRNQEMAKLSFCQSLNLATVEEIFICLSQLAESLIIGARDWLYKQSLRRKWARLAMKMATHSNSIFLAWEN